MPDGEQFLHYAVCITRVTALATETGYLLKALGVAELPDVSEVLDHLAELGWVSQRKVDKAKQQQIALAPAAISSKRGPSSASMASSNCSRWRGKEREW